MVALQKRRDAEMGKPDWMNQSFSKSSSKAPSKQINGVKDCGSLFHKPKVLRMADGGSVDDATYNSAEYQADKATGLEQTTGDTVSFWDRLKAGNIDDPNSEAYKRWGAGKGKEINNRAGDFDGVYSSSGPSSADAAAKANDDAMLARGKAEGEKDAYKDDAANYKPAAAPAAPKVETYPVKDRKAEPSPIKPNPAPKKKPMKVMDYSDDSKLGTKTFEEDNASRKLGSWNDTDLPKPTVKERVSKAADDAGSSQLPKGTDLSLKGRPDIQDAFKRSTARASAQKAEYEAEQAKKKARRKELDAKFSSQSGFGPGA
jgi:hypothetical protein